MQYYSALKKEFLTHVATWTKLKDIMLTEISQFHKKRDTVWFHSCEVFRVVKLIETGSRKMSARGEMGVDVLSVKG